MKAMQVIPPLPKEDFSKSKPCIVMDFENTISKNDVLMDLYCISPGKALKATIVGIKNTAIDILRSRSYRNFKYIATFNIKQAYCKDLSSQERRELGSRIYQIDRRNSLEVLFHVIDSDDFLLSILTSCHEDIARGYLESFNPKGSAVKKLYNYNIVGSNGSRMIWKKEKEDFVRKLKEQGKRVICVGDSEVDAGMLNIADYSFVVRNSLLSNLLFGAYKARGYRVDLPSLKMWFDNIKYREKGIIG